MPEIKQIALALALVTAGATPALAQVQDANRAGRAATAAIECAALAAGSENFQSQAAPLAAYGYQRLTVATLADINNFRDRPESLGPLAPFLLSMSVDFWAGTGFIAIMNRVTNIIEDKAPLSLDAPIDDILMLRQSYSDAEFQLRNCSLILPDNR